MAIPTKVINGETTGINTSGQRITLKPTPIVRVVVAKVRSLGTGNYIAFGDEDQQRFRLTTVGASIDIDWIDDLSKVIVSTDIGSTGEIEYIGG